MKNDRGSEFYNIGYNYPEFSRIFLHICLDCIHLVKTDQLVLGKIQFEDPLKCPERK